MTGLPGDNGTFRCYVPKKFTAAHLEIIEKANAVIAEYEGQGYSLTLRQLFYQGVARGWWPNRQEQYTRLGDILTAGRLAGVVSWTAIEDRGRNLMGLNSVDGPPEAIKGMMEEYRLDLWANQDWRPEVWVEKQALEGVIGGICNQLRVDFYATKGYASISETWRAGNRLKGYINKGQRPIIFHLGDHDPSGIDMTRHVQETLSMFVGSPVLVQRLALNMDQVEELDPPPNPVKFSDSRAEGYVRRFGEESWELDALPPDAISSIIEDAILRIRDPGKWDEMVSEETQDKRVMEDILKEHFGDGE